MPSAPHLRGSIVFLPRLRSQTPPVSTPTPGTNGSQIARHPCAKAGHFPLSFDCGVSGLSPPGGPSPAMPGRFSYFRSHRGFEAVASRQSFAKELRPVRRGARAAFHFVAAPGPQAPAAAAHVASQLAILQRSEISNPPAYGARIAARVLNDPALFAEWEADLRAMSGRIVEMRRGLRERLERRGTPGSWDHITSQIGMFSFTGLSEAQVQRLREKWHVYMTKNGRISMAGLNSNNIDYFAEAVDSVVREVS
ncbi:aspartate aminotransferase [Histoplasma capsulatum H143]|uniref:Aspartate aminotransferase n=1 Tax=Ajellomyces capsulatus (strain H143) TaxID=544712 RepID=C6HI41_AJECH|nr:aspartate aminotransferase [Histoplasma capsulatum H143]